MSGPRRNLEFGLWPGLIQLVRGERWRCDVVAPLNDDRWDSGQSVDVRDQLALIEPSAMVKVVIFDAGKGQSEGWFAEVSNEIIILLQGDRGRPPTCSRPPRPVRVWRDLGRRADRGTPQLHHP